MPQKPPKDSSGQKPLPPLVRKSMESGMLCYGAVTEDRIPESAVLESQNMNFDIIGAAQLRLGATVLGNNLGAAVTGIYYFSDTVNPPASNTSQLIVVAGTAAYYLNSSTYSSIRGGLTAGSKARFNTYLNFCFMVNGTEPTAIWDGVVADGFVTSGNASGAPSGQYIENFRGRMWISGNSSMPDRLYYSSVPSTDPTPVISWDTSATGQWLDVSPSDGETITGLQRFRNVMLVFKTHHIYRVFDINNSDPDPCFNVGTYSQESVVETKMGIYFHDASGFYLYNVYGNVSEISRPMIDYIRAIPTSAYSSITGWLEQDGNNVCWAIGTVTVRGVTYTNCEMRYSISTELWTIYTKPTQWIMSIRRPPWYNDTTNRVVLTADGFGNVLQVNTGTQDVSSSGQPVPIPYSLTHRWETVDGLLSTRKIMQIANFSHVGGAGTNIAYQTEKQEPDDLLNWSQQIDQTAQLLVRNSGFNSMNIKARKFRFRLFGESTGAQFIYRGYELLAVLSEFITFEKN